MDSAERLSHKESADRCHEILKGDRSGIGFMDYEQRIRVLELHKTADDLAEALEAMRDAVKASGKMNHHSYDTLGITVNNALARRNALKGAGDG